MATIIRFHLEGVPTTDKSIEAAIRLVVSGRREGCKWVWSLILGVLKMF